MGSRASLNKVLLIGNLTRDPELRYTPSGAAVCTFGLATNRTYVASDGTKKEEAEFIKIVSWNKLAELCSQLLTKGRKVYVEGRMQTRSWETPDGQSRQTTEVVIDDMRILDSRKIFEEAGGEDQIVGGIEAPDGGRVAGGSQGASGAVSQPAVEEVESNAGTKVKSATESKKVVSKKTLKNSNEESKTVGGQSNQESVESKVDLDDLPF